MLKRGKNTGVVQFDHIGTGCKRCGPKRGSGGSKDHCTFN